MYKYILTIEFTFLPNALGLGGDPFKQSGYFLLFDHFIIITIITIYYYRTSVIQRVRIITLYLLVYTWPKTFSKIALLTAEHQLALSL